MAICTSPVLLRCGRGYLRNMKLPVIYSQEWRLNRKDTKDPNDQQRRCIHICNLYIYISIYTYMIYQSEPEWSYSMDMMTSQNSCWLLEVMAEQSASICLKTNEETPYVNTWSCWRPKELHQEKSTRSTLDLILFNMQSTLADHFHIISTSRS